MGMVHHANYLKWFEEARLDFMSQLGLSYAEMEQNGVFLPVLEIHCQYLQKVVFGETVVVASTLTAYSGIRFEMAYRVFLRGSDVCHTTGASTHCFMDGEGRPIILKRTQPSYDELFRHTLNRTMKRFDL